MKRITSFIPRTLATLEKHVIPSSSPVRISKPKPIKRTIIRKHKHKKHNRKDLFMKQIVSYLVSDSYMYNPLVSPQPAFDFLPPKQLSTFTGGYGDVALPIRRRNKKLVEKVFDFLEADCYLYSPLLTNDHVCSKSLPANPSSGTFKTLGGSESTETQGRPVVTRTVAYRETMKHMFRQNYGTKPIRGAMLETETKRSVE
ncbi:unnamed protein product [Lactuca saligna]|uniref:Uncharacterized protein n=1 Tax=Lactuca saligna TaxID=75948 RepID=A0AA35Z457_LACSI|nr:unnamed protein product [Lactuca saligna]